MKLQIKTLIICSLISIASTGCTGSDAGANLGVQNGRLAECPSSPNCVSTYATDADKKMEPLPFFNSIEQSKQRILDILSQHQRVKLVSDQTDYIHAEFRSAIFRFVDDVEFFFDDVSKQIHFRSASRTGHSDFGVNRKRMQLISDQYLKPLK